MTTCFDYVDFSLGVHPRDICVTFFIHGRKISTLKTVLILLEGSLLSSAGLTEERETLDTKTALLQERYFLPGEDCDSFLYRLASFAARGDGSNKYLDEYLRLKYENLFWENSPYLMNAGTENPMLSA